MPILLAIAAGLCWGIGELATRSALHSQKVGPFTAIAIRSTVALPLIWAAWLVARRLSPRETIPFAQIDAPTWLKLTLGSGLVAGAAAMIFFYAALSMADISRIKPIAFALAPATAVILGWLILGEPISPRKLAGVALILAGVVTLTK